jgi:ribosome-binding ATPase
VVRVFESSDIIHVHGKVDPKFDIEIINSELVLADMETLEKRIINQTKKARADKKEQDALEVYESMLKYLSE